jgi:glycosyltransferase involved in cell wall biosynthesis
MAKPCIHANKAKGCGCGGKKWSCSISEESGYDGDFPASTCITKCEYRLNPEYLREGLKISAVIPCYNEDPEKLQTTVDTMQESILDGTDLEIILLNDGTDIPVDVDNSGVTVVDNTVDNNTGIGAMQSINKGIEMSTGDVVTSWDSHMRVSIPGTLETLASKALENEPCITVMPSRGYDPDAGGQLRGCYMYWNIKDGIQCRWRNDPKSKKEWIRVPAMMGADYGYSRKTIEMMSEPTGQFWDNIIGRWGFGEQSMAIKAFLMDVPIYLCNHHPVGHFYRDKNPLANSGQDVVHSVWENIVYSTALVLHKETFNQRLRPYCSRRMKDSRLNELVAKAEKDRNFLPADIAKERKIFTDLFGYQAKITETHPDNSWIESTIQDLKETKPQDEVGSILVFRPNEILFDLVETYPNAKIHVFDFRGPRYKNWRPVIQEMPNVSITGTQWSNLHTKPKKTAPYDVVLICGDKRDECRGMSEEFLASGGVILESPTRHRFQLEHGQRRDESKKVVDNVGEDPDWPNAPGNSKKPGGNSSSKATGGNSADGKKTNHDYLPRLKEVAKGRDISKVMAWADSSTVRNIMEVLPEADIFAVHYTNDSFPKGVTSKIAKIPNYGASKYAYWPIKQGWKDFDLVFVDGRRRLGCMVVARQILSDTGILIIHDAERNSYKPGIDMFAEVKSFDGGRTRVLKLPANVSEGDNSEDEEGDNREQTREK